MNKTETPEKKTRPGLDPELQVMARIDRLMSEAQLADDQLAMVFCWFSKKYCPAGCSFSKTVIDPNDPTRDSAERG